MVTADHSVLTAVESDLAALALRSPGLESGTLAATARALAREIDSDRNSATSKSMCAARIVEVMAALTVLAPAVKESPLDEIRARRDRAAGQPAATRRVSPRRGTAP